MRDFACCVVTGIWLLSMVTVGFAQPTRPGRHDIEISPLTFSVPDGVTVEKIAGEPLIKWPIVADWDREGRLVVAESGGVSRPIQEHNELKLHKIVRLVDDHGDGVFDRRVVAAAEMPFPEGVLCLGHEILVAAPPEIWRLTDNDGDGVCEQRSVFFDGKTMTGCANDLHGPYLGRDGWIYWCKGAFAEQTHELVDGNSLVTKAAHIFRGRLAGGPIESVVAGGMDNPVEMAFLPEGEKFFTSTFLRHPGNGLRDGIAHAVYGGVHGKEHSVLAGHLRTGELMPVTIDLGAAAPSGLTCLESRRLMAAVEGNPGHRILASAQFNLQKVALHTLIPDGASFSSVDVDLMVGDRVDFHPTDVLEDADGSLIVLDTGGWYGLCCPTSRVDQTTAAGGIYRIRSAVDAGDAKRVAAVNWNHVDESELAKLLFDERPWVRREAKLRIRSDGAKFVPTMRKLLLDESETQQRRLMALWTLCAIGSEDALEAVAGVLGRGDHSLRQAACHVMAVHRFSAASPSLMKLAATSESLAVKRAAIEALGMVRHQETVGLLLSILAERIEDRHLEHSVLYALMTLARDSGLDDLLQRAETPTQQAAVFLVLDQIGELERVPAQDLFAGLVGEDEWLNEVAERILLNHPEFAASSTPLLSKIFHLIESDEKAGDRLLSILVAWNDQVAVMNWLAECLRRVSRLSPKQQTFLARSLGRLCPDGQLPESWVKPLSEWLRRAELERQLEIADGLANMKFRSTESTRLYATLFTELAERQQALVPKLRFIAAIPAGAILPSTEMERDVIDAFLEGDNVEKSLADHALGKLLFSQKALQVVLGEVEQLASVSLTTFVEAVARDGDETLNTKLLESLPGLNAAKTLPEGYLGRLYSKSAPRLKRLAGEASAKLAAPPADMEAAVATMLASLDEGDPVRGLQVFRGEKANCAACHRMGYLGDEIGPVLTRIGRSRTKEALLRAIMFPSERQEQSYQSKLVITLQGNAYSGLIVAEDSRGVELQLDAKRRMRIPRDEIETISPSSVSLMPRGLHEQLTRRELADLLALLESAK